MNQVFLHQMKSELAREKTRVEEELSRFAHRAKDPGNNLSLEGTLGKLLRDILEALKRMESGEYGICKYCSREISESRLRARPTSSSCIMCKKTLTQEPT